MMIKNGRQNFRQFCYKFNVIRGVLLTFLLFKTFIKKMKTVFGYAQINYDIRFKFSDNNNEIGDNQIIHYFNENRTSTKQYSTRHS